MRNKCFMGLIIMPSALKSFNNQLNDIFLVDCVVVGKMPSIRELILIRGVL